MTEERFTKIEQDVQSIKDYTLHEVEERTARQKALDRKAARRFWFNIVALVLSFVLLLVLILTGQFLPAIGVALSTAGIAVFEAVQSIFGK